MYVLAWILYKACDIYCGIICIYILMTWFPIGQSGIIHDFFEALGKLCNPFLDLFRKIVPPLGGFDFSPVVAILVLQLVVRFVVGLLL